MAEQKISYDELIQILELIKAAPQFSEFHLKFGDIEIDLSCGPAQPARVAAPTATSTVPATPSAQAAAKPAASEPPPIADTGIEQSWPQNSILVRSPMVGTFYRAPAPGAPPFVEVGQAIEADTTVCIIEVMKLMNSIAAGARGTVTHILAADGELVEPDQVIMVIEVIEPR